MEDVNIETNIEYIDENEPQEKFRTLVHDLKSLDFPDDIKKTANQIFMSMNCPTKRSKKRKLLLFFCIYSAYMELGIPQIPNIIAKKVNISSSEVSKAMALFSESQTGYHPPYMLITPLHYLPDLGLQNLQRRWFMIWQKS
jgi:transcription initiation factor TFIIIB Brf1 subunit/transcription initiation factor TFIIB